MKLCIFVGSRANFGRLRSVIDLAHKDKNIDLKLLVAASGLWVDIPYPYRAIECLVNADTTSGMVLTTALLLTQIAGVLKEINPDYVLVHGDRYEVLAVALAAAYMNIPLAHTEGGDVSGTIDDKVRYAITELADIHFPVTFISGKRLNRKNVHVVGSTALDGLKPVDNPAKLFLNVDDYIVVLHHPNTTDPEPIEPLIEAVKSLPYKKVWLNPNVDAGYKAMLEKIHAAPVEFVKNLPPDDYINLIYNAKCCIGNSSSFIKEGAFFGIPVVLVGNRQENREHGDNVMLANMETWDIVQKTFKQIEHGRYDPDYRFGDGHAAEKIIEVLTCLYSE